MKKIKKMKRNSLILITLFMFFHFSCSQNENTFFINDYSPVILNGRMGKIELTFQKNGNNLENIRVFNCKVSPHC